MIVPVSVAIAILLAASQPALALRAGGEAPGFELPRVGTEGELALEDLQGKWVMLDFWATWCGPCVRAMQGHLDPMWTEYGEESDFWTLVSVGTPWRGETAEREVPFIEERGYDWNFVFDASGDVSRAYGVQGIPTLVIINPEGRIAAIGHGEVASRMEALLNEDTRAETEAEFAAVIAEWETEIQRMQETAIDLQQPSMTITLEARESAILRVTIEEAGGVTIRTQGEGSVDTVLTLYDENFHTVAENDDIARGNYNSQVVIELDPGIYYITVREYRGRQGSLRLSVEGEGIRFTSAAEEDAQEEEPQDQDQDEEEDW